MEAEKPAGPIYSAALLGGVLGLVGLGLAGLPVSTAILLAFASCVVGILAWCVWEILAA